MTGSVVAVIQARASSTRLPGKVLRPLASLPVLGWVVRAARAAALVDDVVVATSDAADDDAVAQCAEHLGAGVYRGPLDDVLARFVGVASTKPEAEAIVRLTADCPLLDPRLIDATIALWRNAGVDYASTVGVRSLPRGLDVEVVSRWVLEELDRVATGVDRVHVTSHLHGAAHAYTMACLHVSPPQDRWRVTLDTQEDADMLDRLVGVLGDREPPRWRDVVEALEAHPEIAAINAEVRQKAVDEG